MKSSHRLLAALVACNVLLAPPIASGHHSAAMFDEKSSVTLSGVVSKFAWVNPHAMVSLDVTDQGGGAKRYVLECSSPNLLTHKGWKVNTLKAGESVTVTFHPLKNGKAGGLLSTVTLPGGIVMKAW